MTMKTTASTIMAQKRNTEEFEVNKGVRQIFVIGYFI